MQVAKSLFFSHKGKKKKHVEFLNTKERSVRNVNVSIERHLYSYSKGRPTRESSNALSDILNSSKH